MEGGDSLYGDENTLYNNMPPDYPGAEDCYNDAAASYALADVTFDAAKDNGEDAKEWYEYANSLMGM
jgi:hypothetical protein